MNRANCDVVVLFLVSQFSPQKIASHSCWPKVLYVLTARVSWADNEVEHVVDVGIDSRNPLLATANTPGYKSDNVPSTSLGLAKPVELHHPHRRRLSPPGPQRRPRIGSIGSFVRSGRRFAKLCCLGRWHSFPQS